MEDFFSTKENAIVHENMYCSSCGAVFVRRDWRWDASKLKEFQKLEKPSIVCEACYRTKNDVPLGMLTILGLKDASKKASILKEIEDLAAMETERKPMERVTRVNEKTDETVIFTTTADLAKKMGHSLHRRFRGSLSVDSRSPHEITRVVWILQ